MKNTVAGLHLFSDSMGADEAYVKDIWLFSSKISDIDPPIKFDWNRLSTGLESFPSLAESLKRIAWCWLCGGEGEFKKISPSTAKLKTNCAKRILLKVAELGYEDLALVSSGQIQQIIDSLYNEKRDSASATVYEAMAVASDMFRFSQYLNSALTHDPFPLHTRRKLIKGYREGRQWEAPPDKVCVFLLSTAMKLIEEAAKDSLSAYESYVSAVESARARGIKGRKPLAKIGNEAIKDAHISCSEELREILDGYNLSCSPSLAALIRRLQDACFIVITYTVGMRVSEIRRACVNGLRSRIHANGTKYDYYHAPRSKLRYPEYSEGESERPWVISSAAATAFSILEQISRPIRNKHNSESLWVAYCGNGLWPLKEKPISPSVLSLGQFNNRLNSFARFIRLEEKTGWSGYLHSHMGRKHLARFIGMRDRTALQDLATQYSHASVLTIDSMYARPDSDFKNLVDSEVRKEVEVAVKEIAYRFDGSVYQNGDYAIGKDRLSEFVGRLKRKSEVNQLLSKGVNLVPCNWGVCLYESKVSACGGGKDHPNQALRSPEVCYGCLNFHATNVHKDWWVRYKDDCLKLLATSNVAQQTRLLLESRLQEATSVLHIIAREGE